MTQFDKVLIPEVKFFHPKIKVKAQTSNEENTTVSRMRWHLDRTEKLLSVEIHAIVGRFIVQRRHILDLN